MSIQPGVGYSFKQSSSGTVFDIDQPYTDPAPLVPLEQFKVVMDGDKAYFSKGHTISRVGQISHCLRHYNLISLAVYPTASKTAAPTALTDYMDDGASFTLVPPVAPATTKVYNFSIIVNQYNVYSGTLYAGVPYAALMEVDGDAYAKTTPGFDESGCDAHTWVNTFRRRPVAIAIPISPYEVLGNLEISQDNRVQNYNCQRLKVATIFWQDASSSWGIVQNLLGPITIPHNFCFVGAYPYVDEDDDPFTPPDWWTSPSYATEQEAWEGAYSDSVKWNGSGSQPSQLINA
jgi:hypothetical protein